MASVPARRRFVLAGGCLLAALAPAAAQQTEAPEPPRGTSELLEEVAVPEANQGVGVDARHFYAVDNTTIVKLDKASKKPVARWEGPKDGPLSHLDSAVVVDGRLYAAHSNYPDWPMTSSVEIWDAATMEHVGTRSFGINWGSLTWLDRHDGRWWAGFANYNRVFGRDPMAYGNKYNTQVIQFDDDWRWLQAWTIPEPVLEKFEDMSNSGGSWGPDGRLYLTGHDPAEVYVMELPEAGSVLEWVGTVPVKITGQGIAWDRSRPDVLYGMIRGEEDGANFVTVHRVRPPSIAGADPG